jgi:hypothetical protein
MVEVANTAVNLSKDNFWDLYLERTLEAGEGRMSCERDGENQTIQDWTGKLNRGVILNTLFSQPPRLVISL